MFNCRFKTFEYYRNDLLNVFDLWDRTKGVTRSPPTPTNQSEEDHLPGQMGGGAGAKKSMQKKDKGIGRFNRRLGFLTIRKSIFLFIES